MTDQPQRQQQEETRKEIIVEAAARIFAEKGFSGTSNRDIGREAGVSPGLIYWYFEDKNDLFKAVVGRLFPLSGLEFPEEHADELELEELLELIGTRFMEIMSQPDVQRLMRLAISETIRFPDVLQELGRMIGTEVIRKLADQIDARVERGEIPEIDTRLASQAFFGSLIAYVLRKYILQSVDLQETRDDAMVQTVARIYAAGLAGGGVPASVNGES